MQQAAPYLKQLKIAGEQYRSDLRDADDWSRAQLQLYKVLLDVPFMKGDKTKYKPRALDKMNLKRLVGKHELESALRLCETLGDASILMQAQYEIGRKLFIAGAVGLETWEVIQHKTMYLLWKPAEQAPSKCLKSNFAGK